MYISWITNAHIHLLSTLLQYCTGSVPYSHSWHPLKFRNRCFISWCKPGN
uniref:Uncharacterized protein n=1 Tax=Anguilla anguilla TaxID=7936 RepID=A0A0E9SCE4_ANGAN